MANEEIKKKKKKKKGPLRIEAIVPITIVILLFGFYFKTYFDSHLRWVIEYGATQAHGAEINVGSLKTNFLAPSIGIYKIQVTDKSKPENNVIQIGQIKLQLLWDGLLRGKFVIPESSILEIQTNAKRKRPGRILPPNKASKGKNAVAQAAEDAANQTIDQLKQQNESNLLADVFSVAGGTNYKDQLKKMEGQIKSKEKLETLEKELKAKETEWKKKIDDLPDESEVKKLVKKIEGLKIDTSNPQKLQESLKKVDAVYKESRQKYKTIKAAKKAFKADMAKYDAEYKQLEKMVQDDINGIANKLNIPSLDPKEINKMLLGNLVAAQLGSLYKYKDAAREYMPTKSAAERKKEKASKKLTPKERAQGVDYKFPKKKSYPQFWLQKAKISSDSKKGEGGDLTGTLTDLTDNPRHLGKPTVLEFTGGFPHQNITNVTGNIIIDHTTDTPVETGELSVGSFPVTKNTLTKSSDLELGYNKAVGSSKIKFIMKDQTLQLASNSIFREIEYYSSAKDKLVARLLQGVVGDLNDLTLNIRAKGGWGDLGLNINSNLGDKLSKAIKGQISGEIDKARKDVENHIRGIVGAEKGKLKGQIGQLEKQLGVSLKSREDAMDSVKTTVDKKKKEATNKEKKKVEKKLKKEADKLLKGIKF